MPTDSKKPLSPKEVAWRDKYLELVDAPEHSDWELGKLTNEVAKQWQPGGKHTSERAFYRDEVYAKRKGRAPSFSAVTSYARVADKWSDSVATQVGMGKCVAVWSWLTFQKLPFPADPSSVKIPVTNLNTGEVTTKTAAQATEGEILKALSLAKHPPVPPSPREQWLMWRAQMGLEDYRKGAASLLHLSHMAAGMGMGLGVVPADDFIELIDALHDAIHKDIPGGEEP